MKLPKVFRPRRGLFFSDDLSHTRPAAYFVGGKSMGRTRQTPPKKRNVLVQTYPSVVASGSVNRSVKDPYDFVHYAPNPGTTFPVVHTSSLSIGRSTSYGRLYTRDKYNAILLGKSEAASVGTRPYSMVVIDSAGLPTGSFTSPSWTHRSKGFNQAFVGVSLSSSYEETHTLNYYRSGSAPLEQSAVPASASLFYSKKSILNKITVKLTSSQITGLIDDANFGTIVPATASINQPTKFNFSVPVEGKLTDIKVWVEVCILSGGTAVGSTGSAGHLVYASILTTPPLDTFGISLRSPNVSWPYHWAHPVRNDPQYQSHLFLTGTGAMISSGTRDPQEFYRDSFLLWEPPGLFDLTYWFQQDFDYSVVAGSYALRQLFPMWARDIGMRTIFTDGSNYANPRHLRRGIPVDLNANGAPNVTGSWPNLVPGTYQHGNNVPWFSDSGSWGNNSPVLAAYNVAGSPPPGWLTGPGSTANVNEWPTTGSNYGAQTLRPLYPLLDPIYQKFDSTGSAVLAMGFQGGVSFNYPDYQLWRGFRPGLRGTEISGTWTLMFARAVSGSAGLPWMFVRQARLEITYTTGRGPVIRQNNVLRAPQPDNEHFWGLISGSEAYHLNDGVGILTAGQDSFVHGTYTTVQGTPGSLFGVGVGTGTIPSNAALQWWLTGTIADISGAAPGWLLNNPYRMPVIPISSASLVQYTASLPPSVTPAPFINQAPLLAPPAKLIQSSEDANPRLRMVELASAFVSGTNENGST